MKGYVARKGDRWYAVIYHGVDPDTGRERRQWVPAGTDRTKAEAIAARLGREETERRNGHRSELTRSRRISSPNSSEEVFGLPAQLGEVGELGKDVGHGISLRPGPAFRQRRSPSTNNRRTQTAEVDSVLPAGPAAPSRASFDSTRGGGG
jgi:hypothetical protein